MTDLEKKMRARKQKRIFSIMIFFAGLFLGMALFGGATWADLEAFFYFGSFKTADEKLGTLRCPVIINADENEMVTIRLTNRHSKAIDPLIRVDVSDSEAAKVRKVEMRPNINPGSTERIQWAISSEDMIFGNVVAVKVFQFETYKTPSREGTCGTLVVDLPLLTGVQIYFAASITSVLMWIAGIVLWARSEDPMRSNSAHVFYAMLWMGGMTLAGMVLGYLGWWVPGLILFLISALIAVKTILFVTSVSWQMEMASTMA